MSKTCCRYLLEKRCRQNRSSWLNLMIYCQLAFWKFYISISSSLFAVMRMNPSPVFAHAVHCCKSHTSCVDNKLIIIWITYSPIRPSSQITYCYDDEIFAMILGSSSVGRCFFLLLREYGDGEIL